MPFGTAATLAVGADFNKDGQPDLAALNQSLNAVEVTLGSSSGPLAPAIYSVGNTPAAMLSADFNGDGIADLATVNYGDSTVSVLLGNPDGSFQAAKNSPAGTTGEVLAAVDVNGDNKLDLIVANYGAPGIGSNGKFTGGAITLLLGNGSGTFAAPTTISQGAAPLSLVIADFNRDGIPDIAYGDYNLKSITVLPGKGGGAFGAAITSPTPEQPDFLGFGDFNGDGIEDVAVLSNEANTISEMFGLGSGAFGPSTNYSVGNDPGDFSLGDVNSDGNLDIVVLDSVGNGAMILLGTSNGAFIAPRAYAISQSSAYIVAADFNGDGKPDFLTANPTTSTLSLFLNQGTAYFGTPVSIALTDGGQPAALASGDFNGDGKADAVVASSAGIAVLLGTGSTLAEQPDISLGGFSPAALATGDFNGDGKLDFAVAGAGSSAGSVAVYFGDGMGNFQLSKTYSVGTSPVSLAVASLNSDGAPDLAVADSGGPSGQGNVFVLLNQGKGTFGAPTGLAAGTSATAIATGDMNLDKHTDLVVVTYDPNSFTNSLVVLPGNGGGTFGPAISTPIDAGAGALVVTDFNQDSIPDVMVSTCCNFNDVNYLVGNGDGTFQPLLEMPAGLSPAGLAVADFNGDGTPDLAVAASAQGSRANGYAVVELNFAGTSLPRFFAGQVSLGSGVEYLQFPDTDVFGYYTFVAGTIFYHYEMGYEAFVPGSASDIYLYDFSSGHWWYTSSSLFPYLYDFTLNSWIYYFPNTQSPGHYTTNPRYFSNLTSGQIFKM